MHEITYGKRDVSRKTDGEKQVLKSSPFFFFFKKIHTFGTTHYYEEAFVKTIRRYARMPVTRQMMQRTGIIMKANCRDEGNKQAITPVGKGSGLKNQKGNCNYISDS